MGEVYRARDPRLERDVAIKVLPEHFLEDADSLSRFQSEAKAIASLSHPNIVAIHDTGQEGKRLYVVTELLEGETMRSRLRNGPFGVRKAAEHAARVAEGLAAAHEKGIVHRDIKPENLFLLNDGRVKILDFGLARQDPLLAGTGDLSSSPTAARPTNPGAMIGTVGYLAPEQARGEVADHRADIFSLGAVLHEMLTGRRAFPGTSPAELHQLDPARRAAAAVGVRPAHPEGARPHRPALPGEEPRRALPVGARPRLPPRQPGRRRSPSAAPSSRCRSGAAGRASSRVALVALALLGGGFAIGRRVGGRGRRRSLGAASSFQQMTDQPGEERQAQIGPTGAAFVFVSDASGNPDIYLQRVGRPQPGQPHPRQPRRRHRPGVLARRRARSPSAPSGTARASS